MSDLLTYFSGVLLPAFLVVIGGLTMILSYLLRGHIVGRIVSIFGHIFYGYGGILTAYYSVTFVQEELKGLMGYEWMLLIIGFPLMVVTATGMAIGIAQRHFSTTSIELQG